MRLRARGVPLLRIYNDARKAAGLRISYQTFAGYVSESSKQAGLRPEKAKAEAGPSARTGTGMEPASVVSDAPAPAGEAASMAGGWNCPACPDSKPEMHKGQRYFACPKCGIAYAADQDGNQTQQRFTAN